MSADFKTLLIKDSRLADITDQLDYAVVSGASSTTYQQFQAVSQSASSLVWNIQIPSESIVVSREVLLQATCDFTITINKTADTALGTQVFNYGVTDSLQSFPISSLFTTLTATINNTNVSINLQDVFPQLQRLNDSRELYRFNGMTPVLPDQAYLNYKDGYLAENNPLGSYKNSTQDVDLNPRGSFPVSALVCRYTTAGGAVPVDNSPEATDQAGEFWRVFITFTSTEPLFLSPFIFGDPEYNCGGFAGINTMNFVANIDSTCKRLFSTANIGNCTYTIGLGQPLNPTPNNNAFTNSRLLFNFLSTQPSDLIPVRNVCPYMDYPRYLSLSTNSPAIASGASADINSQNIQLNQLPDYFIIVARKPMSQQTIEDSSSFLPINNISINLNNTSGLLSSATANDLWRISVSNNSTQSWTEFSGKALYANNTSGVGDIIPTTGSLLILSPPKDLSLPDYITSGSIGQYNFQFRVNVTNSHADALQPEICVICVNSGVFVSQMGSSNIYTGVLTKQMVLDTKEQKSVDPVSSVEYKRMMGGKMHHMGAGAVRKFRHHARRHGGASSGGAYSGGASSGGASSGGVHSRLSKFCS
jgi:hypothetical protein